ncbi:uncharacterized protein [Dysidea avara]|uniref:uncharacterized protein isoform X2 n=1 Tax=Dysidea avara TaxID=196820 RepID=UPI003331C449
MLPRQRDSTTTQKYPVSAESRLLRCLGTVYNLEVVQGYIAEEEFVNMYINWTGKKAGHSDWGSLSTENVCTLKGAALSTAVILHS